MVYTYNVFLDILIVKQVLIVVWNFMMSNQL